MFQGHSIRVSAVQDGILEVCFDRQNESINKLDGRTVEELATATAAIRGYAGLRGVLVCSAKDAFIVGADIFEFKALFERPENEIATFNAAQNEAFRSFEDLPVPIVTAINGFALGGGLEMALASDYRVASHSALFGAPEVTLGLFPGLGGTVRLPRVAGAAVAIDWICSGKSQNAEAALGAGLADAVVAPSLLRDAALELLHARIASGEWRERRRQRRGPIAVDRALFAQVRSRLAKTAGNQPAALAALELMEQAAALPRDEALQLEHAAFARIARTQAAASLTQLFVTEQLLKKKGKALAKLAHGVHRAAVLGAGIMGGGIAYASAVRGTPIIMKDIAQEALDLGQSEARKLLAKQLESGRITSQGAEQALSSIVPALDYSGFGDVDVVVEAVVENLQVKKRVLSEVENLVKADTIIASNTSSLSIEEIAAVLKRPQNFAGMHFFNPVPAMPLVEVIKGSMTSESAAATIVGYAVAMGKTPIVVKDCPGFLVNRVLNPYMLGFLRAVNDGVDYLAIDRAMLSFGWPMGPAHLLDVIGMDTANHVIGIIAGGYPERMMMKAPQAVQLMVGLKRLGQKNQVGFYRYQADPKGKWAKVVDPETAVLLAGTQPHVSSGLSESEIQDRLMLPMILEAVRCLEERIAESAGEIDMALVLGLGFPRHVGGALKYADWIGLENLVARCDAHEALGPMYTPTAGLRAMAAAGRRFYG